MTFGSGTIFLKRIHVTLPLYDRFYDKVAVTIFCCKYVALFHNWHDIAGGKNIRVRDLWFGHNFSQTYTRNIISI